MERPEGEVVRGKQGSVVDVMFGTWLEKESVNGKSASLSLSFPICSVEVERVPI